MSCTSTIIILMHGTTVPVCIPVLFLHLSTNGNQTQVWIEPLMGMNNGEGGYMYVNLSVIPRHLSIDFCCSPHQRGRDTTHYPCSQWPVSVYHGAVPNAENLLSGNRSVSSRSRHLDRRLLLMNEWRNTLQFIWLMRMELHKKVVST